MALHAYLAGEIVQDCADGFLTRREAMRRLGLLGVGLAGATALLAGCGGDDDAVSPATTTSAPRPGPGSPPTAAGGAAASEAITFSGPAGQLQAAYAAAASPKAGLLVIHENRGLTPHFRELVGRLAGKGYTSLCVDLVSGKGGTDAVGDPGAVGAALSQAPREALLGDLRAGLDQLEQRVPGKKLGAVGFCFGGGMAWRLIQAGEPRLAAVVPFYGPAPEPADFSQSKAAVLGIYAERDSGVNGTRDRAKAALEKAGLTHEIRTFAGADHAFFNDTGQRYNAQAAAEASEAMLAWFDRHLGSGS